MKTHYEIVTRLRSKNTDIISCAIAGGEWNHVATVPSIEAARILVRQLNLGAAAEADAEVHVATRAKRGRKKK